MTVHAPPPPPALPHCLTISWPRWTVEQTLHFKSRNDVGEVEDISVELSTQDEFDKFAPWGAALFSMSWTTRRRVTRIMTINKALAVMADPNLYLSQQHPFDEP